MRVLTPLAAYGYDLASKPLNAYSHHALWLLLGLSESSVWSLKGLVIVQVGKSCRVGPAHKARSNCSSSSGAHYPVVARSPHDDTPAYPARRRPSYVQPSSVQPRSVRTRTLRIPIQAQPRSSCVQVRKPPGRKRSLCHVLRGMGQYRYCCRGGFTTGLKVTGEGVRSRQAYRRHTCYIWYVSRCSQNGTPLLRTIDLFFAHLKTHSATSTRWLR